MTQDYGVAAMALGKGAFGMHQSGIRYTQDNMDQLLLERHLSKRRDGPLQGIMERGRINGLLRMMNGLKGNSGGCWIALWRSKEFLFITRR